MTASTSKQPGFVMEFWVMRVLLHPGPRGVPVKLDNVSPADQVTVLALVKSGDLVCLPDGCIAEPVEMFATEPDAHEHRKKLQRDKPGSDYRVILNTNVTV